MPNKDGTGPNGKGKLTGRGLGNCEGKEEISTYQRPRRRGCCNRRMRISEE